MILQKFGEIELLISGSADRSIKIWDPSPIAADPCIQTLIGHGGSILEMKYISTTNHLISTSTDKSIRIWRLDKGREVMYYPWFVSLQIISSFASVSAKSTENNIWINTLDITLGDRFGFICGDSEGTIRHFKYEEKLMKTTNDKESKELMFTYANKYPKMQDFGIKFLLNVQSENLIFSSSHDYFVKGYKDFLNTGSLISRVLQIP